MNKNDINKLKDLYKLVTNLGKHQYFLEELIEKESMKREKHIANVKKYNSNNEENEESVENKEFSHDDKKENTLYSDEFQSFLRKFREKQNVTKDTDTQNINNLYTNDLE